MSPHQTTLTVGMCQMLVEPGEPDRNLERAVGMIRDAARQGCHFAVLPECLDLGWTFPGAAELAEPVPGRYSDTLRVAAQQYGIPVVAGLTEKADDRIHNAALLISAKGRILLKHRKINLLTGVEDVYATGDRLSVARVAEATVGVNICADNFPDSLALGHSLARMGADILLSPCAWAVDADHDNRRDPYGGLWRESYCALAKLYAMPVVGVSNVGWIAAGPWKGRKCIGCSLAVGAGGDVIAEGPYGADAESMIPVVVPLCGRPAMGTAIAGMLRARGYPGPL